MSPPFNIKLARFLVLVAGVGVSWFATITNFVAFYNIEGTIFKIKDCLLPNPVVTPCFWGALAFVFAAIWSYKLYKKENLKHEKYFLYFMVGCVLFAWSNFTIELMGVTPKPGAIVAPCPATTSSPFVSPCFFGSVLFTFGMALTYIISRKVKNNPQ